MKHVVSNSISYNLLAYWTILVIWQNINNYTAKTTADLAVKTALLLFLVFSFVLRSNCRFSHLRLVLFVITTMIISFLGEKGKSLNSVVYYCFTIIIIFCVYGLGDSLRVSKKDYLAFINGIIIVSLYSSIYAILFCTNQFISAFKITNAYGNELASFFQSSHEFALYISSGIISCAICIKNAEKKKRYKYYFAMIILIPNLLLSYSRTAILGTIVFFFLYVILIKNDIIKKWVISLGILAVMLIVLLPVLHDFVFNIVFKGNHIGSRENLYSLALKMISDASTHDFLFGYGINETREIFEELTTHGSVHNAYLQVMLYFGAFGVLWFIYFLINHYLHIFTNRKRNTYWTSVCFCLLGWSASMMLTNTFILYTSPVDSFFMTLFSMIIPKYVINSIRENKFENSLDYILS